MENDETTEYGNEFVWEPKTVTKSMVGTLVSNSRLSTINRLHYSSGDESVVIVILWLVMLLTTRFT